MDDVLSSISEKIQGGMFYDWFIEQWMTDERVALICCRKPMKPTRVLDSEEK